MNIAGSIDKLRKTPLMKWLDSSVRRLRAKWRPVEFLGIALRDTKQDALKHTATEKNYRQVRAGTQRLTCFVEATLNYCRDMAFYGQLLNVRYSEFLFEEILGGVTFGDGRFSG